LTWFVRRKQLTPIAAKVAVERQAVGADANARLRERWPHASCADADE